jgi:hypothetical protein
VSSIVFCGVGISASPRCDEVEAGRPHPFAT